MHWEKAEKTAAPRIQIRKAQNRGCCSNLQQAPRLAPASLRGWGLRLVRLSCPCLQGTTSGSSAEHMDTEREARARRPLCSIKWAQPGLPLPAVERLFLFQSDTSTQRPTECTKAPQSHHPGPSLTHQLPGS